MIDTAAIREVYSAVEDTHVRDLCDEVDRLREQLHVAELQLDEALTQGANNAGEVDRLRESCARHDRVATAQNQRAIAAEAKLDAIEALCKRPGFRGPLTHVSVEDLQEVLGFQP